MTKPLHVIRVDPPGRLHVPPIGELITYRELLFLLAWRDIKVRYKQTALGAAWAILQPLLTMVMFTAVFGRLGHIPSDDVPYALFALAGLVPWTFFANGLLLGSTSLVTDVSLVTKVYFPRIFIPFAMMAAGLVDLAIALSVLVVMVFVYGRSPSPRIVLLPLLILMLVLSTLGITLFLAALNVRYRDVRYVIPFLTQLWLFATPVAYSTTLLHGAWRSVAALNPMAGVVQGFRWAIIGTNVDVGPIIALSSASTVALLVLGLGYFSKVERTFADIV